ncbi:MAG TPA: hypothetical protein VM305_10295 [Candidatus Limnocylindrales bacterium]|nr:hypothetical protein [Candidatus Limnocylindrales bacterium]
MELLLFLGLMAVVVMLALGVLAFLRQRRDGTILVVSSIPVRALDGRRRAHTGRASSAHK